jgi:GTP-binding protein
MFVNDVGLLHFSYRRYLEKAIRERFGLSGNPLKLVLRAGTDKRATPPGRALRAGPTSPRVGR